MFWALTPPESPGGQGVCSVVCVWGADCDIKENLFDALKQCICRALGVGKQGTEELRVLSSVGRQFVCI